jgi:hypothetical protein
MYALNFKVHKAQLLEHNCCISQGLSVVEDIQVKTTTRNTSLCQLITYLSLLPTALYKGKQRASCFVVVS